MGNQGDTPQLLSPSPEFFERIPTSPGVYLMKNQSGTVVYVGKAKNLRARVRQYFRSGADARFFVVAGLLRRVLADVETVVVNNEKEALLLENHLIKKHQPRFNVNLRDDKQYLVLRIDPSAQFPRVEVVRNIRDDKARYFGPYHSATSCRETLRTLNRHFQLRTCSDHVLKTRTRTCLQYQIKRCPGPCVFPIEESSYAEQVDDVMMFLTGKSDALVTRLSQRMRQKSELEQFETAAQLRNTIQAVERTLAKQHVVQEAFVDQDVFGIWRDGATVELVVLFVRSGKLVGHRRLRQREQEFSDSEVMTNFVQQYYASGTLVPGEIVVPTGLKHEDVIVDWLSTLAGRRVKLLIPKRGTRMRLIELANKNAKASAKSRSGTDGDQVALLETLQKRLSLRRVPRRIECFDIAHIQGAQPVASRVVFCDGVADRSLYRKYKIRTASNDDYAAMYEVLSRRIRRIGGNTNSSGETRSDAWEQPDLIVVDGGKGQLRTALAALADAGWNIQSETCFDVIGLAKPTENRQGETKPDRVFLANRKDPIQLRPNTTELFLLAQIRDEAHRFANTFHQQRRKNVTLRSTLDSIPGIGTKRKRELLRHFGSMSAMRRATEQELSAVDGMNTTSARAIKAFFDSEDDK